jgi:hypothetical protein
LQAREVMERNWNFEDLLLLLCLAWKEKWKEKGADFSLLLLACVYKGVYMVMGVLEKEGARWEEE